MDIVSFRIPAVCVATIAVVGSAFGQDSPRSRTSERRTEYRPYFGAGSTSTRTTARTIVDLRRSQRSKQFVPNEMGKVQEWNRWSVGTTDPWARSGSWEKSKAWEDPSAWKGDGLERTSRTLTYTRGRNPTSAERHPVRAANGSRR